MGHRGVLQHLAFGVRRRSLAGLSQHREYGDRGDRPRRPADVGVPGQRVHVLRLRTDKTGRETMTATFTADSVLQPSLMGHTVVASGGSLGIGLETARLAREEGADVILVARDPERLQ